MKKKEHKEEMPKIGAHSKLAVKAKIASHGMKHDGKKMKAK